MAKQATVFRFNPLPFCLDRLRLRTRFGVRPQGFRHIRLGRQHHQIALIRIGVEEGKTEEEPATADSPGSHRLQAVEPDSWTNYQSRAVTGFPAR